MSLKQTILGLCVSAVALVGTVTTVSAAGGDVGLGFGARPTATSTVRVAATTPGVATVAASPLRLQAPATSFDDAPAAPAEEALPASSLAVLALAALMSIGLLMTRRGGRA